MALKNQKSDIPPPPGPEASSEEQAAYFEKYGLDELEAAGYVQELSPEEKKDMEELAATARARIADRKTARTQLNLALSSEQLARFIQHANQKHLPPSTLARAWLLERLDQESKDA